MSCRLLAEVAAFRNSLEQQRTKIQSQTIDHSGERAFRNSCEASAHTAALSPMGPPEEDAPKKEGQGPEAEEHQLLAGVVRSLQARGASNRHGHLA